MVRNQETVQQRRLIEKQKGELGDAVHPEGKRQGVSSAARFPDAKALAGQSRVSREAADRLVQGLMRGADAVAVGRSLSARSAISLTNGKEDKTISEIRDRAAPATSTLNPEQRAVLDNIANQMLNGDQQFDWPTSAADTMRGMMSGFNLREEALDYLKQKVTALSEGQCQLESADPNEFRWRVRGPAEYLQLTRGDGPPERFTVTPTGRPLRRDPD